MNRYFIAAGLVFACLAVPSQAEEATVPEHDQADRKLVVFYFHNTWRCSSCNSIESLTRAAIFGGRGENSNSGSSFEIESPFSALIDDGTLTFEAININLEENKPRFETFGKPTKLPIIAALRDGQVIGFEVFGQVWRLLGDNEAFVAYIQQQAGLFINRLMEQDQ